MFSQNFESPRTFRKPVHASSRTLNSLQLFEQPTAISQNDPMAFQYLPSQDPRVQPVQVHHIHQHYHIHYGDQFEKETSKTMHNSYMNPEDATAEMQADPKSPMAGANSVYMTNDDTSMDTSVRTPHNQNEAHF